MITQYDNFHKAPALISAKQMKYLIKVSWHVSFDH